MAYETLDGATQARVLIVGGGDVDAAQFERAPRLELLVRAGIGLDRIDHTAAAERGVTVVNTPGYGTNEVADQAQMLLLACTRRLDWQRQRAGDDWPSIAAEGVPRLADSTVGLIGFGAIGRAMAQRCRALGSTVLATDPAIAADTAAELGVQLVPHDELAERSDIISLHAPLSTDTRHLVDAAFLARTRPHLCLINTARGALVDTDALLDALAADPSRTAGLDVVDAMRISVDTDKCVGGGQCVMTADDLFDQDDDGIVVLLDAEPGADRLPEARTAARLCPSGAIEVEE